MIGNLLLTFFFFSLASTALAQSGRVKPLETQTPVPFPRPGIIYIPSEKTSITQKPALPKTKKNDDDEIISVESNLVPIPVSVLDIQGRAVTNLKLEDFELAIDGQTAEISEITRTEAPVRLALLFDNSSSVSTARVFEKKAAVRFFRSVIRPEKDLAALYSVSTGTRLEQPFTKSVSLLVDAIENFPQPAGATALLDAVVKAADYLKTVDGRRIIVIVSDGEDTISDATFDEAVKAVQVNNCQVYVVKTKDFENFKQTGHRGGNANIRVLAAERRMQELAAQTGGAVFSPIDEEELDSAFNQISADLSHTYVLNYYSESEKDNPGEFRAISLKVKRRENLTVRTRKGYYVPRR